MTMCLAVLAPSWALLSQPVAPQVPLPEDLLHIRVHEYEAMMDRLEASIDQRHLANAIFDEYRQGVEGLLDAFHHRVRDCGIEEVHHAQALGRPLPRERTAEIRKDVGDLLRELRPQFDAIRTECEHDILVILDPPQGQLWLSEMRAWRRNRMLNPLVRGAGLTDLSRHPDVIGLAGTAAEPGGELYAILGRRPDPITEPTLVRAAVTMSAILRRYEEQIEAHVVDSFYDIHDLTEMMQLQSLRREMDDARETHARLISYWDRAYKTTLETVEAIGRVLDESSGVSAKRRWIDRYRRALMPDLLALESPQWAYAWLVDSGLLSAEQHESIGSSYEEYLSNRERLVLAVIEVRLLIHREQSRLLGNFDPRKDDDRLVEIESRRSELARRAISRVETLLTAEQRSAFRAALDEVQRMGVDGRLFRH